MTNPNPNFDPSPSPSPRRGSWRRLFFWGLLGGGLFFLLMTAFLISLTLPNLREVAPPEISGERQQTRPQDFPEQPNSPPPSRPRPVSVPRAQVLPNLNDFPHLSPRMRTLTQAWLDQCAQTSQALEAITDPALHERVRASLEDRNEKMRQFLRRAGDWNNQAYKEDYRSQFDPWTVPIYRDWNSHEEVLFHPQCAELNRSILLEKYRIGELASRMEFELFVHRQEWGIALEIGADYTNVPFRIPDPEIFHNALYAEPENEPAGNLPDPDLLPHDAVFSWEEEIYCWQQLGNLGLLGLTARSYQKALDSQMENRGFLRGMGGAVVDRILEKKQKMKTAYERPYKRFWFED